MPRKTSRDLREERGQSTTYHDRHAEWVRNLINSDDAFEHLRRKEKAPFIVRFHREEARKRNERQRQAHQKKKQEQVKSPRKKKYPPINQQIRDLAKEKNITKKEARGIILAEIAKAKKKKKKANK